MTAIEASNFVWFTRAKCIQTDSESQIDSIGIFFQLPFFSIANPFQIRETKSLHFDQASNGDVRGNEINFELKLSLSFGLGFADH